LEYVLLIYGALTDNVLTGHQLIAPSTIINQTRGHLTTYQNNEAQVLCLLVKPTLPRVTVMVPIRTPLNFLLKATHLEVKLHSIPVSEAERCKETLMNDYRLNDVPPFFNAPHRLVMFYNRPSRPTPYQVQESRPRNLLYRRTLNFPY
jgi:hypothetical protein